jgi:hypothetical protein
MNFSTERTILSLSLAALRHGFPMFRVVSTPMLVERFNRSLQVTDDILEGRVHTRFVVRRLL